MLYRKNGCRAGLTSIHNKITENCQAHTHSPTDFSYIQKNLIRIDGIPDLLKTVNLKKRDNPTKIVP